MLKTRASRESWLLVLVALLVLGAGLGLRDPWPADEPRFALVAKHMVESGDWLFPHRGTELYSDKPPMLMWFEAAFYLVFRDWRIAFLLPSLLAALGTLWCVYDLGRRLWTRKAGRYAAWALLFAFQFAYQSKKAQIDPLVTFYITLANYGLLRHLLTGGDWRMWTLGWFAAGLGTITKGVGAVALLMLLPAAALSLRDWPRVRVHARDPKFWLGPLAFVVAISIWLAPMAIAALGRADPAYRAYLDDILFRQTAGRYSKSWAHHQPPWYFLEVMLTVWMPVTLAFFWAFPAWRTRLRRRDPRYALPLAWWVLMLLFFSIPSGKRDMYILPALPMVCLALGPLLPGIVRKLWARRVAFVFAIGFRARLLIAGLSMRFGDPAFESKLMADRGFADGGRAIFATLIAMGAWMSAAALWHRARNGVVGMLWAFAGLWVLYGVVAAPLLNPSSSSRGLMTTVSERIGPQAELGLVAWREQQLLMADRPAATFGFKADWSVQLSRAMRWQAQAPQRRWLLVQEPALSDCVDKAKSEFAGVSNRRRWWLVPADAIDAACEPSARAAHPDRAEDDSD